MHSAACLLISQRRTHHEVHMKNLLRINKFVLFAVLAFTACELPKQPQQRTFKSSGKVDYDITTEEASMLDSIQKKIFLFFRNERRRDWGIVRARAASWAPASIASTGFGIPCFAIGVERKWISREQAAQITLNTLESFYNSAQSAATNVRSE